MARKTKEATVEAEAKEMPDCGCGCGGKTKGGKFLPGHDMKLKSALITSIKEGKAAERTKALKTAESFGWDLSRHIPEG